jgi:hypothetical protein
MTKREGELLRHASLWSLIAVTADAAFIGSPMTWWVGIILNSQALALLVRVFPASVDINEKSGRYVASADRPTSMRNGCLHSTWSPWPAYRDRSLACISRGEAPCGP